MNWLIRGFIFWCHEKVDKFAFNSHFIIYFNQIKANNNFHGEKSGFVDSGFVKTCDELVIGQRNCGQTSCCPYSLSYRSRSARSPASAFKYRNEAGYLVFTVRCLGRQSYTRWGHRQVKKLLSNNISFSSSNNQFYESRISISPI